jgi:FkbM family methyltransferase
MFRKLKSSARAMVPGELWENLKLVSNKGYRITQQEAKRIDKLERYQQTETTFLNRTLRLVDNRSFLFIKKEIFDSQIYKFVSKKTNPYIIDCGANIGLSIIYFKQLYPAAEIMGFEPDKKVFDVLRFNVEVFQLSNVTLFERACWNKETTLQFYSEGADGGRTATEKDVDNVIEVKAVRLREYLNREVDFLKIDIEGAETEVLEDCADLLPNVDKLFVEYHSFTNQNQELSRLLQILNEAGFRYQVQHIGVFSPNPFVDISSSNNMDLQLNIFAYRQ